jgi:hypothetical protein
LRKIRPFTPERSFMAKTAALSLRLEPTLKAELEALAQAHHRPVAAYVELILSDHVQILRHQGKLPKTDRSVPLSLPLGRTGRRALDRTDPEDEPKPADIDGRPNPGKRGDI